MNCGSVQLPNHLANAILRCLPPSQRSQRYSSTIQQIQSVMYYLLLVSQRKAVFPLSNRKQMIHLLFREKGNAHLLPKGIAVLSSRSNPLYVLYYCCLKGRWSPLFQIGEACSPPLQETSHFLPKA